MLHAYLQWTTTGLFPVFLCTIPIFSITSRTVLKLEHWPLSFQFRMWKWVTWWVSFDRTVDVVCYRYTIIHTNPMSGRKVYTLVTMRVLMTYPSCSSRLNSSPLISVYCWYPQFGQYWYIAHLLCMGKWDTTGWIWLQLQSSCVLVPWITSYSIAFFGNVPSNF